MKIPYDDDDDDDIEVHRMFGLMYLPSEFSRMFQCGEPRFPRRLP
jgi:hypothetical protein